MKKIINKNTIIAFVLGGLIFSTIGISVTAISTYIDSKAVSYTNNSSEVQNVNSALNELYDLSDTGTATAEDINEGKTAIVQGKLITGTRSSNLTVTKIGSAKSWNTLTVNISTSYPEYADFTIDNFFVQPTTWAALSDNF